jgi:hypothetical protein
MLKLCSSVCEEEICCSSMLSSPIAIPRISYGEEGRGGGGGGRERGGGEEEEEEEEVDDDDEEEEED